MHLLIIGSLDGQIGAASQVAMQRGARVSQADDVATALQLIRDGKGPDLVMIDVKLDVAELVDALKAERMHVPVVACGVQSDTQAAVRAIKAGAKEYIPLPPSTDLIAAVLAAVAEEHHAIIHADPRMMDLLRLADQIAPSEASVFITGPSGTGKELIAHHVHAKSKRKDQRFVAVNCAAIPETLLESELFGHEKGAFTGAVARRLGKFEEANGGTLLLDEISEMDIRLQAKLLRVIQERELDRIGGNKPIKVDVRILATSNRRMEDAVAKGEFREDLYFRLNVVNLQVPPLKERPGDIEILAKHFVKKFAESNGMGPMTLGADALAKLKTHPWPGNVRELENTLHRAVLVAGSDTVGAEAVLLSGSMGSQPVSGDASEGEAGLVGRTVADVERELIIDTVDHCLGNRTHAATILGISIRTLRNKLKQYSEDGFKVVQPGGDGDRPAT